MYAANERLFPSSLLLTLLSKRPLSTVYQIFPRKATDVSLPVTFSYSGMGAAGASVIRRGQTDLLVEGTLTFVAPLASKGTTDIAFRGEATIVLSNDPPQS